MKKMTASKYFPQGLALDVAFCNRDKERERLKNSIKAQENIVLVAPRRYGKTSLITQVLLENDFLGINIDFFFALTQEDVNKQIAEKVTGLINTLLPKTKKACLKMIDSIKALNPKLTFNFLGQQLEISATQSVEKSIAELLVLLDHVMEKTNKYCVIALDEFQQIGELKENHSIEAAIRHAVERSKRVSYIFSGSKRHLLNEMFSNKSRPLYHLCDLMVVERISVEAYTKFLQNMAKKRWKKKLDEDAITEILELTKCHPYYVNILCRRVWAEESRSQSNQIAKLWIDYINQQSTWLITEISNLTLNQKKVLTALASEKSNMPQGRDFCKRAKMNPSGVDKSLQALIKSDNVYQDNEGYYQILDPAILYFLKAN